jgi:hypothetical protein
MVALILGSHEIGRVDLYQFIGLSLKLTQTPNTAVLNQVLGDLHCWEQQESEAERGGTIVRFMIAAFSLGLVSSTALAGDATPPKKHLLIYRTEHSAREHCPNDQIVWANTTLHTLYLPGNAHFGHTRGGYACESEGRAHGYRGPTAHV